MLRHQPRGQQTHEHHRSSSLCMDWTGVPDALLRAARRSASFAQTFDVRPIYLTFLSGQSSQSPVGQDTGSELNVVAMHPFRDGFHNEI